MPKSERQSRPIHPTLLHGRINRIGRSERRPTAVLLTEMPVNSGNAEDQPPAASSARLCRICDAVFRTKKVVQGYQANHISVGAIQHQHHFMV